MTDPATRIAYDVEQHVGQLGQEDGARLQLDRLTPRAPNECSGAFKAQFDRVGMLAVWCYNASGQVVGGGTTSYISRFIDLKETWVVDKKPGETLTMTLERRGGRAVVTAVR
ncbi:hypothetical protein GCM10025770_13690 [Viridibacterium curvum]|uniref:Lipocalin-like domain-containing protein n=2 Tax=Viridibacterium curvum TaxID=1101404 RepID=A0ABP9QIT8_9RHOO